MENRTTANDKVQKFPRAKLTGHVMIHDDEKLFIAPLENISAGGVFIRQLVSLPQGRDVKVVVKSPNLMAPVQAVGRIVRVERGGRFGLAVEFSEISEAARSIIETCVLEDQMEASLRVA